MSECPSLITCAFFKEFERDEKRRLALKGFVRKFCKGPEQENCVRKKIKAKLGIALVPVNMMPNGSKLSGTSSDTWDKKVLTFLQQNN
ncbi:hypothetical protein [Candidatus Lokiarchaeum ossiferum]|uniref:hypothetical protein n=1 Tax=Candidatus Lokiarchaeum ossiferum TaxID=2951803 RepID=UPI00352E967B